MISKPKVWRMLKSRKLLHLYRKIWGPCLTVTYKRWYQWLDFLWCVAWMAKTLFCVVLNVWSAFEFWCMYLGGLVSLPFKMAPDSKHDTLCIETSPGTPRLSNPNQRALQKWITLRVNLTWWPRAICFWGCTLPTTVGLIPAWCRRPGWSQGTWSSSCLSTTSATTSARSVEMCASKQMDGAKVARKAMGRGEKWGPDRMRIRRTFELHRTFELQKMIRIIGGQWDAVRDKSPLGHRVFFPREC